MIIWISLIVVFLIAIAVYYFNKFVVLENRIENSTAQINVQLRKRADLVPSLVKTVKGYAKHEKEIMDEVTKARKEFLKGGDIKEKMQSGNKLQDALKSIFAIAENYPELRANENFLHLQKELSAIEDKVAYARQYYNDSIMSYENASERIPGVFFFKLYGRKKKEYLKIPAEHKAVPKIQF
jgi:LemA protein